MTLYEILGIEPDATPDQIKAAHRKLVKINHPDKGGDPERFTAIQSAFDVLSDPERRARYDATGDGSPPRDEFLAKMASILSGTMQAVLSEINDLDLPHIDLVDRMKERLANQVSEGELKNENLADAIAQLSQTIDRLSYSGSRSDILGATLRAQMTSMRDGIEQNKETISSLEQAMIYLTDYRYETTGRGLADRYTLRWS